ncbi:MAG: hypothetical protein ACU85E_16895 [Gammaproteobacteria bacterium]
MKEKYITDNGYGASVSDMKKGYSDQGVKDHEEPWMMEYEEEQKYRKTGFGRDTGQAR